MIVRAFAGKSTLEVLNAKDNEIGDLKADLELLHAYCAKIEAQLSAARGRL